MQDRRPRHHRFRRFAVAALACIPLGCAEPTVRHSVAVETGECTSNGISFAVPHDAQLWFEPTRPQTDPIEISLSSDRRSERFEAAATGSQKAALHAFAGEIVTLRAADAGGRSIELSNVRVEGAFPGGESIRLLAPAPDAIDRANVLLYVIDALRADRLSSYGYPRATTPRIDQLAADGIRFASAYSTGPNTPSSIPGLFTSLPASEASGRLRRDNPGAVAHTLAEKFRDAGYQTAAFQANFWLRRSLGFARGFQTYEVMVDNEGRNSRAVPANRLHARAIQWVRRPERAPFFLYIQSMDVHSPYAPPEAFRGRFPLKRPENWRRALDGLTEHRRTVIEDLDFEYYDDAVAYADHEFGRLLDALREASLLDSTIVVLTADHGESLGEDGRYLHGVSLHEEQVHVPLIVSVPWARVSRVVEEAVSLSDLAPTLLELVGAEIPAQFRGRPLGSARAPHEARFAVGELGSSWFLRSGRWKLIATRADSRLYDIESDALERHDVAPQHPATTGYLKQLLCQHSRAYRERAFETSDLDEGLDPEERKTFEQSLRALGYIE